MMFFSKIKYNYHNITYDLLIHPLIIFIHQLIFINLFVYSDMFIVCILNQKCSNLFSPTGDSDRDNEISNEIDGMLENIRRSMS